MSPVLQHLLLGAAVCAPFVACAVVHFRRPAPTRTRAEIFSDAIDAAVEEAVAGWRRDEKKRAKLRAVNDRKTRRRLGLTP